MDLDKHLAAHNEFETANKQKKADEELRLHNELMDRMERIQSAIRTHIFPEFQSIHKALTLKGLSSRAYETPKHVRMGNSTLPFAHEANLEIDDFRLVYSGDEKTGAIAATLWGHILPATELGDFPVEDISRELVEQHVAILLERAFPTKEVN